VLLSCVDESTTQTVQQMSEISDPNFLAEYEKESAWAEGHGVSQRTVARYRELGLPHLFFGGYIWNPKARRARVDRKPREAAQSIPPS
jgi:hypothetical protein